MYNGHGANTGVLNLNRQSVPMTHCNLHFGCTYIINLAETKKNISQKRKKKLLTTYKNVDFITGKIVITA